MAPSSRVRSVILAVALLSPWSGASGQPLVERETYIVQYVSRVPEQQEQTLGAIGTALGRPAAPIHRYSRAFQGLALELSATEAGAVSALPGVARVHRSQEFRPLSDAGPSWIGAPGIWNGSKTGGLPGTQGEGIVIGILDTGINMDHPSFADVGGDGYDHLNPRGSGNYVGWCRPSHPKYSPSRPCNDKLIGVWSWPEAGDNPEDDRGHGSLVASVAAGNHATARVFYSGGGLVRPISGVAPHANLISYDICGTGCQESTVLAAIDQAVADGVDVLNLSFEYEEIRYDYRESAVALALLEARAAGILVTVPAGWNQGGHSPVLLNSPGTAPWLLTANAATHNRRITSVLTGWRDGEASPSLEIRAEGLTSALAPTPVVSRGCESSSLPAEVAGKIVVCFDWTLSMSLREKGVHVRDAGAKGMIVLQFFNFEYGFIPAPRAVEPSVLPVAQIEEDPDIWKLMDWMGAGTGHRVSISATAVESSPVFADIMRGFHLLDGERFKPDLAAPGEDILGASQDPEKYRLASGTSLASAHVAGAAALIRALHPDWTVAEIYSALLTTARENVLTTWEEGEVYQVQQGFGRLDVGLAGRAGLVLDEDEEAFGVAGPATLNVPWLGGLDCSTDCTWTRVVRSTLPVVSQWTATATSAAGQGILVTPSSFTLEPGAVQTIQIRAVERGPAKYFSGTVLLTEVGGRASQAHFLLAGYWRDTHSLQVVKAGAGSGRVTSSPAGIDCGVDCADAYPEGTEILLTATPDPGSVFLGWSYDTQCAGNPCRLWIGEPTTATAWFGVPYPDQQLTNGEPFQDTIDGPIYGGTWKYYWVDVESGVRELVVDIEDISGLAHFYVGYGEKPDQNRWVCRRNGNTVCRMDRPAAGRWWIGVTNNVPPSEYRLRATWAPVVATDFYTVTPCRVLDTRQTYFAMINGFPRSFPVAGLCGIPATAKAVVANITALEPQSSGSVRFYAEDLGLPPMESLYFLAGKTRANQIFLRLTGGSGTTGAVANLDQGGTVHVLLDVFGYFE